jgi:hypothetical protein
MIRTHGLIHLGLFVRDLDDPDGCEIEIWCE